MSKKNKNIKLYIKQMYVPKRLKRCKKKTFGQVWYAHTLRDLRNHDEVKANNSDNYYADNEENSNILYLHSDGTLWPGTWNPEESGYNGYFQTEDELKSICKKYGYTINSDQD